jgi:plasmid maintenance system antidote protein VapI
VTVDMAHRLARAVGSTPEFWLRLQQAVDVWDAQQENGAVYARIARLSKVVISEELT